MVAYVLLLDFWGLHRMGRSYSSRCGWPFISSVLRYSTRIWRSLKCCTLWPSLLVPALIAIVPLVTHAYGWSLVQYMLHLCQHKCCIHWELALWDGPAMLMLIAASTAMIVMVTKLTSQVCRRSKYEPITDGDQFTKALKQLLSLAAFPMLFFIFEIPVFILHVYTFQYSTPNGGILISAEICFSLWSMASGATVIIHISVARICGRKSKPKKLHIIDIRHVE